MQMNIKYKCKPDKLVLLYRFAKQDESTVVTTYRSVLLSLECLFGFNPIEEHHFRLNVQASISFLHCVTVFIEILPIYATLALVLQNCSYARIRCFSTDK